MKTTTLTLIEFQTSQGSIDFLNSNVDDNFKTLLVESLTKAEQLAKVNLDRDLYNALSWPVTFNEYIVYLQEFSRWIPQQHDLPAWKTPDSNGSQEVYDRLCHFYFLIDQPVGKEGDIIVENIPWFSKWLVQYAKLWGSFLNSTDSFNQDILDSFINDSPKYRVQDSMIDGRPNNPSGWLTFNQFFARELNPGLRPIASPMDNTVVTSPADCTFRKKYDIASDSTIPEITIKQTHQFANINQLLEGSKYADDFGGGTFAHYFLGPYSYHRFHIPVSGVVEESYAVQGLVSLDVELSGKQFDAPDNAEGGYEFLQARGIITIDTTNSPYGDMGIVAVIPVGMCQVSSVNMIAQPGHELLKGDEFGYFLFGGSDIIMLFQEGINPTINDCSNYRHYGTAIGECPPETN
ncbi:MAG: phosphatidylserine decarboxylase [Balneolaceae bacterium]|nr:phosphatidylserine decarboxylase [Balneolaceae bacterium]